MEQMVVYSGKVKSFKAVTKNQVQIELDEALGLFELFSSQEWALGVGDELKLIGYKDDKSGKHYCLAYKNISKDVRGWCDADRVTPFVGSLFIIISFVFLYVGLFSIFLFPLAVIFGVVGLKSLKKGIKGNKMSRAALALLN